MQENAAVINFISSMAVAAPGNKKVNANSGQKFILVAQWMQHSKLQNSGQKGTKILSLM